MEATGGGDLGDRSGRWIGLRREGRAGGDDAVDERAHRPDDSYRADDAKDADDADDAEPGKTYAVVSAPARAATARRPRPAGSGPTVAGRASLRSRCPRPPSPR